jgi:ABC-type branched-subunit amino acid transport system substrate-binding protein
MRWFMVGKRRSAPLGLGAVACVLALTVAACSSSSKSASSGTTGSAAASGATNTKCTGEPVKFGIIATLTGDTIVRGTPDIPRGAQAAAAALTSSCALGRPVTIVSCDTKNNPNQAATCGREMVKEKVVAYMGEDANGATWFPITAAAKIPEIGGNGLDSVQVSSPLWFPLTGNVHDASAYATIGASAMSEPARVAVLPLDNPGTQFFVNFFKAQTLALGGKFAGSFPVPASTVDMSQFAAQVRNSGANAVFPIIGGDQFNGLVTQMNSQGMTLKDNVVINLGSAVDCKFLQQVGSAAEGLWLVDTAWPVAWDTANAGAKQYLSELKAAKLPSGSCDVSEFALQAWSAVHIMADMLKGAPTMDAATLVDKLNHSGPINRPELPGTIDFSKNAFPNDPVLSHLRIFSKQFFVSRITNGKPRVETDTPPTIGTKFTPKS